MADTNLSVTVDIRPNIKTMAGLQKIPDRVIYIVARMTLDQTRSDGIIPKDSGRLRTSSMAGGVKKSSDNSYYIGSYTGYAKYVWKMHDVNWTTSGTDGQWYARTMERHGQTIIKNAIDRGWRQSM